MSATKRTVALGAAMAMAATGLIALAAPAAAVGPCPPYGPLDCAELVVDLDDGFALDFTGTEGGVTTAAGAGTGFTLVQPKATAGDPYIPANLAISGGNLAVTTTAGIAFSNNNSQDNTLGVALPPSSTTGVFDMRTSLLAPPPGSSRSEQAGLWFGPTQDIFVKTEVVSSATAGQVQVEVAVENFPALPVTTSVPPTSVRSVSFAPGTAEVALRMRIDPVAATATAFYQIGTGAETTIGTVPLPRRLVDGTALPSPIPGATNTGGIYTTHRTRLATAVPPALTYTFTGFSITEPVVPAPADTTPPAAPVSLTATPGLDTVALTWPAVTDPTSTGYLVFRSTTTPVATTGTPFSGTVPLTGTTLTDDTLFSGESFHYAVTTVDEVGNRSAAAQSGPTGLIALPGTPVAKIDFGPASTAPAAGYLADNGAAFGARDGGRQYGWLEPTALPARTPVDVATNTRLRAGVTPARTATLIHLPFDEPTLVVTTPALKRAYWEYAVAPGRYAVSATVGDIRGSTGYDSTHRVRAEGVAIDADGFVGTDARQFDEDALAEVTVTDGFLTIDSLGGVNTKLSYLEITSLETADVVPPATPAGLAATPGDNTVSLTWGAVTDAATYRVWRGTAEPVATTGAPLATVTSPTVTVADATAANGTQYFYVVAAGDAAGHVSPAPAAVSAVPAPAADTEAPPAPTGLTATISGTTATLTWNAVVVADLASYTLVERTACDVTICTDVTRQSGLTAPTATVAGLTPGQTYQFFVRSVDTAGNSSVAGTVVDVTVPVTEVCPAGNGWVGEYYATTNLPAPGAVTPTATRCDPAVSFDFGAGGPGLPGVGVDGFSVRWTRTVTVAAGTYTFSARADDGIRVFVDGVAVIDEWRDQGAADVPFTGAVPLTAGAHALRVEYYEGGGGALVDVSYALATGPTACATGQWTASYYDNRTLTGPVAATECVAAVSRDWGLGGPAGVDVDDFSARWTQNRTFAAGTYRVSAVSDDGIRVLVDGVTVVDAYFNHGADQTFTGDVTLSAGPHALVVEYYEAGGGALARVGISQVQVPVTCTDAWSAEYFANKVLDGAPVKTACDPAISFDYGTGGPSGIGAVDNFSARWTRTVTLTAGTYRFESRSDDGIRISVDGTRIIDQFVNRGVGAPDVAEVPLTAGPHTIVVEYYEDGGGALVQVDYARIPDSAACAAGQWTAQYYTGRELSGAAQATNCVAFIDSDFGTGGPLVAGVNPVGVDNFSIRWTQTRSYTAGTYRVSARADDGIRVRVDGVLVLDEWRLQGADQLFTADVPLTAGSHTVVVEYFEAGGGALARVSVDPTTAANLPPAAPAALTATVVGTGISLSWTASTEADLAGYLVYRSTTATVETTGVPISGATPLSTPTFTDSTAVAGTAYTYVVVAQDTAGQRSPASNTATATVPVATPAFAESWNFQPAAAPVPAGYTAETGAAYSATTGRGWVTQATAGTATPTPLDLTANTRDRNRAGIAQERDTFIHLQYADIVPTPSGANGSLTPGAWERAVPNGTYVVTVSVGDQPSTTTGYDSQHLVRAEGQTILPLFQATAAVEYQTGTGTVVVTDGRLTIDAIGGRNTKLTWVTIASGTPDTTPPAAPATVTGTAGDSQVSLTWTGVADAAGYRVYRSTTLPVATTGNGLAGAVALTGTTFVDTTAVNATPYYYAVVAIDASGNRSAPTTSAALTPQPLAGVTLRVDFGTEAMTPAAGYLLDYGQAYGPRTGVNQGTGRTFGWIDQDEGAAPLSLVGNGRTRGRAGVEPRSDSFIHAQYADVAGGVSGVNARGTWEVAVPDGSYQVSVGVGDAPGTSTGYDSVHAVNIEASAALISFVGTAAEEYRTVTTTVAVRDGRLTVSPKGGTNTKVGYVDITQVADKPRITSVSPGNRTTDAGVDDGVAADIAVPGVGVGVSAASLNSSTVELFELVSGAKVAGSSNTSGGNDTVNFAPAQNLKPFTAYRFEVRAGVLANDGTPFLPFTSVFTTGTDVVTVPSTFTPLTNVGFTKVDQPAADGNFIASMAFGPDGKLYASTIGGGLKRWTVAADGTLSASEDLAAGLVGRAVIGLVFDQGATATNLKVWVTHATANLGGESTEWSSKVSVLTGPTLGTVTDVFVGLPRSAKDHLSNSLIYGPDGDLYFPQGSNTAAGDPDSAWGNRGEKLLTAAVLNFDPDNAQVAAAVAGGAPINVQTADIATPYNPYTTNAPLTIYATGVRNAYDLVWHSNGRIYAPTNGTAGGGNSPGIDVTYSGTTLTGAVRRAAPGTPTGTTLEGTSLLAACQARLAREPGRTLIDTPAVFNHNKQRDFLFNVTEGGYYGHPNPLRCESILNNGANAAGVGENGTKYAAGVAPDPNYRGWAYDFAFNKSPNGVIEYRSNTFGGQLKGRLVVVRFSNNNDLEFIQVDPTTGQSLGAQTAPGITGVPNSQITGVDGFLDPLEIVEDPRTGNLYVNQYDQSGNQQKLVLLRVPATASAPAISASTDELVFSAVRTATDGPATVTVTNSGTTTVSLSPTITGPNAASFTLSPGAPATVAPNASVTVGVTFAPAGALGVRTATLTVGTGTTTDTVALYGLSANGEGGANEPTLTDVLTTVGSPTNVGWTGLVGGVNPAPLGTEVTTELFERAGPGPVTMTPIASYAPFERLPYGWYTPTANATTAPALRQVGAFVNGEQQTLYPRTEAGSVPTFDPGTAQFGFYYTSVTFGRTAYTEDSRNAGPTVHRVRIYPATTRAGVVVANSYIVAFEDADNGDYQDYVFRVSGIKPAGQVDPTPQPGATVRVNFANAAAAVPTGYVRDFGQGYGPRTDADQGTGLTYGWLDPATETPLNLSVGGTTPGNGRDRNLNADQRYDTFMHMTPTDVVSGAFNGTQADGYWEAAVPNGTYRVTVAAGDSSATNSAADVERQSLVVESVPAITDFVGTGAAGSATRHATATVDVTVADGRLTVVAGPTGSNVKINFIDIVPVTVTPGPTSVQVDFAPAASPVPTGWVADTGAAFTTARGYGWLGLNGQPLDRTNATRERAANAGASTINSTLNIMQSGAIAGIVTGNWEYVLPNGTYTVEVSVGDQNFADSTHSIDIEGTRVISGFVPSGPGNYQVVARDITVADGRLTVAAGSNGVNTKIQWIRITGFSGTDRTPPTVTATASGDASPTGAGFLNRATVTVNAIDSGGSGLASTVVSVDGAAAVPYTAPLTITTAGPHTVTATATDGAGNTASDTETFSVVIITPGNGVLTSQNPEAAPFADRYVFSRTETDPAGALPKFKDTATVVLRNTGTQPIDVSGLSISGAGFVIENGPTLPTTIAVGAALSVPVRFNGTSGAPNRLLIERNLVVVSNAANGPATNIQLAGIVQDRPEGGTEPDVSELARVYGFGTTIATAGQSINNRGVVTTIGDEILAPYWERYNTSQPITVRQLAALHSCCSNTATFYTHPKASSTVTSRLVHDGEWAQTVLPRINGSDVNPALTSFTPPTGAFGFRIDGEWSDPVRNNKSVDQCPGQAAGVETATCKLGHHQRVWPVEDRAGVPIPGMFLVVMDYSGINYDFNDNAYLVTNIAPEGLRDVTPAPAPTGVTAALATGQVTVSWAAVTATDLVGYVVERQVGTAAFTRLTPTAITARSFVDTAPPAGSTVTYRVRSVDLAGNESAPSGTASVTTPAPPAPAVPPIRINAGGPAVTLNGVVWAADSGFTGGKTFANTAITDIAGTTSDAIYRTERSSTANLGTFSYAFARPAGRYTVRLHFAEIYHGATGGGPGGTGRRVLSANIEGGPVELSNFDINAAVGPMTAVIREYTLDVTDGTVNIAFTSTVNQPKVSAIEVLTATPAP